MESGDPLGGVINVPQFSFASYPAIINCTKNVNYTLYIRTASETNPTIRLTIYQL